MEETAKSDSQTNSDSAVDVAVQEMIATLPRVFRTLKHNTRVATDATGALKDLGDTQVWVLSTLGEGSQLTSELARRFNVTNPTMTRIVDALVEKGLVERRHDLEDRRCIYLTVTPRGHEIAREAHEQFRSTMAGFLKPLSARQLHDIIVACRHLQTLLPDGSQHYQTSGCPARPQQD